jgi:hypothetical protein
MNIDQLVQNFKTFEELKIFCESQFKQVLQLSKRNKELEDQISELKKQSKDLVKKEFNSSPILLEAGSIRGQEDAKIIAQIQLKLFKDLAYDRELTLDEAKRVDLFNKILIDPSKEDDKPLKANVKVLKNEELMLMVDNGKS